MKPTVTRTCVVCFVLLMNYAEGSGFEHIIKYKLDLTKRLFNSALEEFGYVTKPPTTTKTTTTPNTMAGDQTSPGNMDKKPTSGATGGTGGSENKPTEAVTASNAPTSAVTTKNDSTTSQSIEGSTTQGSSISSSPNPTTGSVSTQSSASTETAAPTLSNTTGAMG